MKSLLFACLLKFCFLMLPQQLHQGDQSPITNSPATILVSDADFEGSSIEDQLESGLNVIYTFYDLGNRSGDAKLCRERLCDASSFDCRLESIRLLI